MKTLLAVLIVLFFALQYRLWFAEGGLHDVWKLKEEIEQQKLIIDELHERNQILEAEVLDLKQGLDAIEERARSELGMIREGESFFRLIKPPDDKNASDITPKKE